MFNFFKRSKGTKKNSKNNKKDNKELSENNQQLPVEIPQSQQSNSNSTMYFNRDNANHNYNSQQQNPNSNRNLFLNQPTTKNLSSSHNNNKISTSFLPNENSSSTNLNNNNYNYCQTNRAPPPLSSTARLENEPKINPTNNNENSTKKNSSRNEFVDQKKRFKYNAPAADNLATNPATNTNTAPSSTNDSYSTNRSKTLNLNINNNNYNYKSDYLDNRENNNSINFNNPKKYNYCSNSVVDELSLPSTSSSKIFSDNKNISDTNNNNKKKSVKFFNPIDKSRDFLNNIMAKGRQHRNKTNHNNNNQQQNKQDHQVIMSNLPEYYPKENKIYNSKGISTSIYNSNIDNYNENNENDLINIGYQITRSKNSPDIFKKIKNSHNYENSDDDENNENIFLSTNHLQHRGEADGSDTNITTNKFNEFNKSANSNNLYRYNNNDDDRSYERDLDTDTYEEHPPVYSKRMPSQFDENNSKEIRKPKSILKKSSSSHQPMPPHQWNNNNNNLVTKSLSNEIDHQHNNKKYDKNCSFLNQKYLNNNDAIDKIEKLSELAECDRDCFINNHKTGVPSSLYKKMGQSQAKTPLIEQHNQQRTRSRSISPPPSTNPTPCPNIFSSTSTPFNLPTGNNNNNTSNFYQNNDQIFDYNLPPIITEPLSPKSKNNQSDKYENIPLPKITIDDFSSKSSNILGKNISGTSPTDSDSDIFYDFDSSPPARSPPRYPSSSPPTPTTFLEDIVEEDENAQDDNDEWHFVSNNDIESLSTKELKKDSSMNIKDSVFTTSDLSSSVSSSSSSASNKYTKDNRNHFIDSIDSNLHDSGFISPSNSQSGKILIINSCDLINDRDDNEFTINTSKLNTKLQQNMNTMITNNLNIFEHNNNNNNNDIFSANHILIDSISLPDVVVESKIANNNNDTDKIINNNLNIPEFVSGSPINRNQFNTINNDINKSHSMGSVHFIPIHIEAEEDNIHIEEIKLNKNDKLFENDNLWTNSTNDEDPTNKKRELINQEETFNAKLEEAEKSAYNAQQKADELQTKLNDLEIDLSTKSWNIERLEAELQSIYKEDDSVRKRLKFLEKEKDNLKQKFNDKEDELNRNYEILEQQYKELEQKYQQLRTLASSLQTQLATAQTDAEECRLEKNKLLEEKDGQLKFLQENLDLARQERQEIEEKWQKEFETLRNQNQNREDNLLTDCEWKLRTMQKNCKDKIDKAEKIRNETVKRADALEELVESKTIDESRFRNLQAEVRQLRGLTNDQRTSLTLLYEQIENLRAELEATNTELEHQIEEVRRMKLSCQNELESKDRETVQKIYDATHELADIWEHKLLTEMTRLTHELETVHVEERLDDMNKLQTEHIEELKVLTSRYTENEQELREQVTELKEQLRSKCDVAFNTRITLDRADREYQIAMSREEEKREILIDQLQKDFVQEKLEMEENFRVRLGEVKNEFAKELANSTEEIAKRHRQQLEQQWDQLVADKEEALQALESRHRIRIDEQEAKIRNLEVQHQRDMKDLKNAYDLDRSSLQTRDINNAQEIDQLHRKCRCLTNLFEEMRVRYERREPRQEDLREIDELRSKCEAQERDLFVLTERLRDMQINMEEMSSDAAQHHHQKTGKKSIIRKPPSKTIPTNCDVIYEENEEREQSPIQSIVINNDGDSSIDDDEDEHNDDE